MQEIKKLLLGKGIKPTHQRLKILEYLHCDHSHPTADKIYQDLVKDMPTMSKTTVYNTLKALAENGIIVPISITGTEVRYDFCDCRHHHFLCEKCHKIFDLDIVCPNFEKREIKGNIIKEIHGYLKGICAECNKQSNKLQVTGNKGTSKI